jgi:2,6-dihydroxypyridine 3-monooxygenase
MTSWPSVAIAGGSIGGLTTAVLLAGLGCDVHVFERSSDTLQSRGTGIVVLPITEKYFTHGDGRGERVSLRLNHWTYVDAAGNIIDERVEPYRFSGWSTVYRALLDAFDPGRYHLDSRVIDIRTDRNAAALVLESGEEIEADLAVCADGVASIAREILLPGVHPEYAGYVAWRGTAPEGALSTSALYDVRDAMIYQVLVDNHILVYAIPGHDGSTEPGRRLINFVWYRNYPVGGPFEDLMTGADGELRDSTVPPGLVRDVHLADLHEAAKSLAPTLREIVSTADDVLIQAIFDLESPRMVFGRTCLLGDAAFALRPHVAAGQAKACADAWELRNALERSAGDVTAALADWEPRQLELGRRICWRSRDMGRRAQFEGRMIPGDADWKFGLFDL